MHPAFELKQEKNLPDQDCVGYLYVHKKTQAQVLYLKNADENKAFAISFKTIPPDNTGVAHILEHSVLSGSENYPVKDPFMFMIKSSMSTFINALTYPDRTMYPVASTNEQDLFNLTQVYLDSIFKPLISEKTFMQEGWHYELFDQSQPLVYKGVVFNEMKGAYSTVEDQVDTFLRKHLYAGSSFSNDSGGNPAEIPNLTYADFKQYHADWYNPANSKSILYGDVDIEKFLALLNTYFDGAKSNKIPTYTPVPEKTNKLEVTEHFAVSDSSDQKPIFIQGWVLPHPASPIDYFALEVLEYLLVRSDTSLLKKALLESGLGESFYDYGHFSETPNDFFAFGLRGLNSEAAAQKVKHLIASELDAMTNHIDADFLTAALNKVEFLYRTEVSYYNNKGLVYFSLLTKFWNYDLDPFAVLDFTALFSKLREEAKHNYFENYILNTFVQNDHTVALTMVPDKNLANEQNLAEEQKLAEVKQKLTPEELEQIITTNQQLAHFQSEVDSEEALNSLPKLKLSDLPKKARVYPIEELDSDYTLTHVLNKETGILEVQLAFDISHIPQNLLPVLGFYTQVLPKVGTLTTSAEEFAKEQDLYFGKLAVFILTTPHIQTGAPVKKLVISFKVLEQNTTKAFELLDELLSGVNFDNAQKLKEVLLEEKAELEHHIVSAGHHLAMLSTLSSFRDYAYIEDSTEGISLYSFYKDLSVSFDNKVLDLQNNLKEIHKQLLTKKCFSANIGCSAEEVAHLTTNIDHLYQKLGNETVKPVALVLPEAASTAFIIPAKVNYVGFGFDGRTVGLEPKSLAWLVNRILSTDYLWNAIRVKGGAYGAYGELSVDGAVGMSSYRDPNIASTLLAFENAGTYLKNLDLTTSELENYKISSIKRFEPFINSDTYVLGVWTRFVRGFTEEVSQSYKEALYNATPASLNAIGELMTAGLKTKKSITVLGNKDAINKHTFDNVVELF